MTDRNNGTSILRDHSSISNFKTKVERQHDYSGSDGHSLKQTIHQQGCFRLSRVALETNSVEWWNLGSSTTSVILLIKV